MNKNSLSEILLKAAWLSILLGVGMELLVLGVAVGFKNSISVQTVLADLVQKISWSTLVCVGVAAGTAAGKMKREVMGLAGLLAAPIAFYVAKALHKSAVEALSIAGPVAAGGLSPLLLAFLKGLEYGVLGFVIGQIGKKASAGLREHALAGLVIGLVFGGTILYLMITMASKPLPLAGIISRGINEILFPVGCSLVLFTAQRLGEKNR